MPKAKLKKAKPKAQNKTTLKDVRLHAVYFKGRGAFILDGIVKNHPKLPDGYITTSVLKWINFEDSTAQTQNTLFHLKWSI